MEKKDIAILALLISLLLAWPFLYPELERRFFPKPPAAERPAALPADEEAPDPWTAVTPPALAPAPIAEPALVGQPPVEPAADEDPEPPEITATLANDVVQLVVSSRGAAVVRAVLEEYRATPAADAGPMVLDFEPHPALALDGLPGLEAGRGFALHEEIPGRRLRLERTTANGLRFTRTLELGEDYRLRVTDRFVNTGPAPIEVPAHGMALGAMREAAAAGRGVYYLGADALLHGGKGVRYFGKKELPRLIKERPEALVRRRERESMDWLAVKNRYFTQILTPDEGGEDIELLARRDPDDAKRIAAVAASAVLAGFSLGPGADYERGADYYAGPKKYTILSQFGRGQDDVMEFGTFAPIGKALLWILNLLHDRLWPHNYGIAIILLTVLIRLLFWPVTHKGTESMRRMQEIQPLMKAVREKHKDPRKQQEAMVALYKEHKVNPMGGCLPMLVQIPVFFALFVVLRSAIELRFARFLWVADLSEPENLLHGVLPFSINILPVIMAVTMVWQQKLTPTATADPRQAKMMTFMPLLMLFLFYGFASGLVLYWTTNQVIMIGQQLLYNRRKQARAAAGR